MSSIIVKEAQKKIDSRKAAICYYFVDGNSIAADAAEEQVLEPLVYSIISQLCKNFTKDTIPAPILDYVNNSEEITFSELKEVLLGTLANLGYLDAELEFSDPEVWLSHDDATCMGDLQRVYLVIDALDEVPTTAREQVLDFILEISSVATNKLRLLVTSRNDPEISDKFSAVHRGWNHLAVDTNLVDHDINEFVTKSIEGHRRLREQPQNIKDLIKQRLVDKAKGM